MNLPHMLTSLMEVMNMYKVIWLGKPEMRRTLNELRTLITQIELINGLLIEGNIYSEALLTLKQQMALQAVALAEAAAIYASYHQSRLPKAALYYTYKDIYLSPARTAASLSQEIHNYIVDLLPALKEYGIREADAVQLQITIDNYLVNLNKEVITEEDCTAYNHMLARSYHKAHQLLHTNLDTLMQSYAETHPDFFHAYHACRNKLT